MNKIFKIIMICLVFSSIILCSLAFGKKADLLIKNGVRYDGYWNKKDNKFVSCKGKNIPIEKGKIIENGGECPDNGPTIHPKKM